jgi:cysteine synthase
LGVGSYLKEYSPQTTVHVCEPDNAPMLYSGIPTIYPEDGTPSSSFDVAHPVWRPHLLYVFVFIKVSNDSFFFAVEPYMIVDLKLYL